MSQLGYETMKLIYIRGSYPIENRFILSWLDCHRIGLEAASEAERRSVVVLQIMGLPLPPCGR